MDISGNIIAWSDIDLTGNLNVGGAISGNINASNIDLSGNLNVGGAMDISGNIIAWSDIDLTGNLNVGGAISGNINASNIDLSGNLNVHGAMDISGNINAWSDIDLSGNLNVGGAMDISGNIIAWSDIDLTGNLNVGGAISGNINASNIDLSGNLNVHGAMDISGNINAWSDIDLSGNLNVHGAIDISGNTTFSGVNTFNNEVIIAKGNLVLGAETLPFSTYYQDGGTLIASTSLNYYGPTGNIGYAMNNSFLPPLIGPTGQQQPPTVYQQYIGQDLSSNSTSTYARIISGVCTIYETAKNTTFFNPVSLPTGSTTVTQPDGDNSTNIATTEFVTTAVTNGSSSSLLAYGYYLYSPGSIIDGFNCNITSISPTEAYITINPSFPRLYTQIIPLCTVMYGPQSSLTKVTIQGLQGGEPAPTEGIGPSITVYGPPEFSFVIFGY